MHFYPSNKLTTKGYTKEPNTTNINFNEFDLQVALRETTENTGLSFRYNIHITKDIRMTYTKALCSYSTPTIFKISNEYQKSSQNVLMVCVIMKTF